MYNILTTDPKFNYVERLANVNTFNKNNKYVKRGIAIQDHLYIGQAAGSASGKDSALKIKTNGNVHIWPCHVDMGQGANPKYIQLVSALLKCPMNKVIVEDFTTVVHEGDGFGGGSSGSSLVANIFIKTCEKMNTVLKKYYNSDFIITDASGNIQTDSSGNVFNLDIDLKKNDTRSWTKLISMFGNNISPYFNLFDMVGSSGNDNLVVPSRKYPLYYMSMSEVEVNMLTGDIQIIEFDSVYDVGSAFNPTIDMNQLSSGYIYGLGSILHEERTFDNNGKVITDNTWSYKPPCIVNVPQKSVIQFLTNKDTAQPTDKQFIPFTAKSTQEMAVEMSATALGAIKGAIRTFRMENGLSPVYRLDVPATVDRIQQASGLTKGMLVI